MNLLHFPPRINHMSNRETDPIKLFTFIFNIIDSPPNSMSPLEPSIITKHIAAAIFQFNQILIIPIADINQS